MVKYSVIIPTYNRFNFLKTAIDSVLRQTYNNFQLTVIDDGSKDGTDKLIHTYKDSRLKYIYQDNLGVSSARNRGISESTGEYIAFLDSDDRWVPEKLEEIENATKEHPGYFVYHTQEKWFRNGKHLNHMKKHFKQNGYIFDGCLKLCKVSISTAVVKRELFKTIGVFDENMPVCEDYDFWLRVSVKYPVYLIDKTLTLKEGGHAGQLSGKYRGMDRFRIKSICKLMDTGNLDEEKTSRAFEELKRKCKIYANGCYKRGKKQEGDRYINIIETGRRNELSYK